MRPFHPPPISGASSPASSSPFSSRTRFRSIAGDLTLGVPQRDHSLAVPLPLPPGEPPAASASRSDKIHPLINFSELEKLNRIGSGNGGTVYKVRHRPSNSLYALKVIYGNHEDAVRNRICREIEILRGADNPHVVRCYGMFDYNGDLQVLLEHMDRGSLEGRRVENERALSDISRQILHGLAYLHSHKIVHRDIKPSNLLMNSSGEVKIADFGVSRILAQTMDNCNSSVGTIAYMSPERINTDLNHGKYDGYAGDIWSFGVSILELYLGRYPFAVGRQGEWASLMVAICMSQPPEAPPTASMEFRDFVARCLQIDPTRRSTSARLLHHQFILQNTAPPASALAPGGVRSSNNAVLLPPPRSSSSSSYPSYPAHPSSC